MTEETETGTQTFHSSSESVELELRQETEVEPAVDQAPIDEPRLKSFDERTKQAMDPILIRLEETCALFANRTGLATVMRPVQGATMISLAPRATSTTC